MPFISQDIHQIFYCPTRYPIATMPERTPQHFQNFSVTFPDERVIQVTLTRTDKLNCIDKATSREISKVWERLDDDETLWVGIITGKGRAFCTGADLGGETL